MVRANASNRLVEPLTELLFLSWGPLQVVGDEFSELPGAERVLVFGSWAARYLQRPGPPPRDLDVLVVGHPARADVLVRRRELEHVTGAAADGAALLAHARRTAVTASGLPVAWRGSTRRSAASMIAGHGPVLLGACGRWFEHRRCADT